MSFDVSHRELGGKEGGRQLINKEELGSRHTRIFTSVGRTVYAKLAKGEKSKATHGSCQWYYATALSSAGRTQSLRAIPLSFGKDFLRSEPEGATVEVEWS